MSEALVFAAVCDSVPLLEPDAIVVLSGDGEARLDFAFQLMRQSRSAPMLVLSGGVGNPPFSLTAHDLARRAIERGVVPDRLVLEAASMNTREQAVNVVAQALERDWHRLVLVASPFHHWRAYLTFVQALIDVGADKAIHVISASASQLKWSAIPDGMAVDRLALLRGELAKIEEYRALGHVASHDVGLAYLLYWEGVR